MILALIQARMGSTRLPGKILKPLCGLSVVEHVINRVMQSREVDDVIVVTSIDQSNLPLVRTVSGNGVRVFVGSEDDVLDRFWQATKLTQAQHVVRITADCPMLDPEVLDSVIALHLKSDAAYTTNTMPPTWPDGLDVEVMRRNALEAAWNNAANRHEREHVTPYIRMNGDQFKVENYASAVDLSHHRWTLDQQEDLEFLNAIFEHLYEDNATFGYRDVLALLESHPELLGLNAGIERNAGSRPPSTVTGEQQK